MDTIVKKKENVCNPMELMNTIGRELQEIFELSSIKDGETRLGIKDLAAKERLSDRQIDKVCKILERGDEMRDFIKSFQDNYERQKVKAKESYSQSKKNFTRLKKIIPLLRNEFNDGNDRLDDIIDFFGVSSEEEIFEEAESVAALFRQQNNVSVDPVNLKAWLRRGELDYEKVNLPEYNEKGFTEWIEEREWASFIDDENYFKTLPEKLSVYGVALVLVPYLANTVYGAVRWKDGHPLIQISDRNQDLATCWFTLFHEFGHVLKHRNEDIFEGALNEPKSKKDKREREANKFANNYLFNGDDLRKDVFEKARGGDLMTASDMAEKYKVNIIFVAYWFIKAQYQPTFQKRVHIDFVSLYQ